MVTEPTTKIIIIMPQFQINLDKSYKLLSLLLSYNIIFRVISTCNRGLI